MKNMKLTKFFMVVLTLLLCLSLTACGDINELVDEYDWRTIGIVRGSGAITRGGEETKVLVCVYEEDTELYYDSKDRMIFGTLDYPLSFSIWNAWDKFQGIDFADLNGDGDVTMEFDVYGTDIVMVWFWDAQRDQFVYQMEESQLAVPVLMGGELPFADMETLQSENREDGTYYYMYATEAERIRVVNMVQQCTDIVLPPELEDGVSRPDDYLTGCALSFGGETIYELHTAEEDEAYSEKIGHPVFVVTYTSGEGEKAREWTVFATDDGRYTYLYGIGAVPDALDDVEAVYQDIFAGLYLSNGAASSGDDPGEKEDYSMYAGFWLGDADAGYDYIEFNAEGGWRADSFDNVEVVDGYLSYGPEEDVAYIYSGDNDTDGGYVELDGDRLYISSFGSFHYLSKSISQLRGTWYLNNDFSAEYYIEIDEDGGWRRCQRTPGNDEASEMDWGVLSYNQDKAGAYYENSYMDSLADNSSEAQVLDPGEGVLVWGDDGTYYRLEEWR